MSSSSDWLNFSWSSSDLEILEARARRLSQQGDGEVQELVPAPTHAFFRWGGQPLALDLGLLASVLPAARVTRLPGAGTGLVGYEREIFWVDTLSTLAGLAPGTTDESTHVMLLRSARVAFWVEELEGLEQLREEPVEAGASTRGSLLTVRRHLADGRLLVEGTA